MSEQRAAAGEGNTRAARRPGGRTGLERRLDGSGNKLACDEDRYRILSVT
jgi:hypothetical protein